MKKFVFFFLFCLTASAQAHWVEFAKAGVEKIYVDVSTMKIKKGITSIWTLHDYEEVSPHGVLSLSTQTEFDCKKKKYRTAYSIAHSLNMGQGELILQGYNFKKWNPQKLNTERENLLSFTCTLSKQQSSLP